MQVKEFRKQKLKQFTFYWPTQKVIKETTANAATVLTKTKKTDHITSLLKTLHWLPVAFRIGLLLVYEALNDLGTPHIRDFLSFYVPARSLRSSTAFLLNVSDVPHKYAVFLSPNLGPTARSSRASCGS